MKIAILGGSFNPIHHGHILLAQGFSSLISADKTILIPTLIPPHKAADGMASATDRINMCKLAGEPYHFEVSDMEVRRAEVSYTYYTLLELSAEYKDAEIYLICGSDMFLTLETWYKFREILTLAVIVTTPRGDNLEELLFQKERLERLGGKVIIEDFHIPLYSSTEIRERIRCGLSTDEMLPSSVFQYIKENNLYGAE